jgi:hypothetical protein
VDEGSGLRGVIPSFPTQEAKMSLPAKLSVDERHERASASKFPPLQDLNNLFISFGPKQVLDMNKIRLKQYSCLSLCLNAAHSKSQRKIIRCRKTANSFSLPKKENCGFSSKPRTGSPRPNVCVALMKGTNHSLPQCASIVGPCATPPLTSY